MGNYDNTKITTQAQDTKPSWLLLMGWETIFSTSGDARAYARFIVVRHVALATLVLLDVKARVCTATFSEWASESIRSRSEGSPTTIPDMES